MLRISVNKPSKHFLGWILLIGCVLQTIISIYGFLFGENKVKVSQLEVSPFQDFDPTNNYMDVCSLPIYDYWHPDVMKRTDPNYDPHKECDKKFKPFTKLVNGNWSIVDEKEGSNCSARCFYNIDDWKVNITDWLEPGPVDCEFLEAVCWEKDVEVYGNIHTQVIPKNSTVPPTNNTTPNVFVFLFDSMSAGQAKRQFNKTLSILSNRLKSVEFPFLNKVGENSMPNGHALWFGKLLENINGESFGGVNIARDWEPSTYCNQWLNESTIFADFEKKGYMTLLIDDWKNQMVNFPNCYGFKDAPTHHYMHPFFMIYEEKGTKITKKHLDGHLCREERHAVFKYFQEFVDAYKGKPKFTWLWINSVGHNDFSGLARADHEMVEILKKNMKVFDNSFVIFMGDHGYRLGTASLMDSDIGSFEKNILDIDSPKLKKKSGILEVLSENSKKLQTHFDVRSTLLDIVRYQPESKFTNRSVHEVDGERGHSFLRHQPDTPRTCGRLPIPPDYCICQVGKVPIYDLNLRERFGYRLIDHIHDMIDQGNFSHICERFQLQEVISLLHYGHLNHTKPIHNYEITVAAGWPSYAKFQSIVEHNRKTNEIKYGKIIRLDTYGTTGNCTMSHIHEKMCYCKGMKLSDTWNSVFSWMFDIF